MNRAEKTLRLLLRAVGVVALAAVVPVVMPFDWMVAIHRGLGMGQLPDVVIVGYLTRSTSALYALLGALQLYLSFDVRRHLPVVRVLGVLYIVFGAVILPIDYLVGMPWFWIVCEGPFVIGMGTVIVWLTVRGDRQGADNP